MVWYMLKNRLFYYINMKYIIKPQFSKKVQVQKNHIKKNIKVENCKMYDYVKIFLKYFFKKFQIRKRKNSIKLKVT